MFIGYSPFKTAATDPIIYDYKQSAFSFSTFNISLLNLSLQAHCVKLRRYYNIKFFSVFNLDRIKFLDSKF